MSPVYITKRAEVAVSHRCFHPAWSARRNEAVYGPEHRAHGHNYLVEVTVSGMANRHTGMVVNIKDVKAALKEVLSAYDHRNLNRDHADFANRVPTTERVLEHLWRELTPRMNPGTLERIRLFENEDTLYETHRPGSPIAGKHEKGTMLITRRYTFSAAHRLHSDALTEAENREVFRDCNNPNGHGHNYTLEVTVHGTVDPETGLAADRHHLDRSIREAVVDRYDYRNLNDDVPEFAGQVTTSENIVRIVWNTLEKRLGEGVLHRIKLGETRDNYFEYYG